MTGPNMKPTIYTGSHENESFMPTPGIVIEKNWRTILKDNIIAIKTMNDVVEKNFLGQ